MNFCLSTGESQWLCLLDAVESADASTVDTNLLCRRESTRGETRGLHCNENVIILRRTIFQQKSTKHTSVQACMIFPLVLKLVWYYFYAS